MYDEKFMRRAIELSAQALEKPGARPYGAVIVKDGKIVGEGLNQSTEQFRSDLAWRGRGDPRRLPQSQDHSISQAAISTPRASPARCASRPC